MLKKITLKFAVFIQGGQAFSQFIRKYYLKNYNITIGYGTYGGCFNVNNIPSGTKFGNYCSIADGVAIFRANHPSKHFTTHPLFYNPVFGFVDCDKLSRPELNIGHDVWIGYNAIILPSVNNIGNGAIIGAGSVVTKDVEPYSIVVGNPAKHIRYRFSKSTIEKLEESQWFHLEKNKLYSKRIYLNSLIID